MKKATILLTIILMDFLVGMEFDLFVPSFPELQNQFGLTPFWVEALLSSNFIGYCLGLFVVGELSDRYGRKPVILLGLVTFVIGSMLCLWALSYEFLLVGRFFQGIGIAAPSILSFLIIADMYPLKKQMFLMAMLNGVMNVSVAIAPVIGSYVTLYFHWQGNFTVLLSLGLIVSLMTLLFIPAYKPSQHKLGEAPVGYLSLLTSKPLMLLLINMAFLFTPYWIFVGMSPLLYIGNLGVDLSHFGYYQGALALIFALGSVLFGLIVNRYNQKKILHASIQILMFSFILLILVTFLDATNPLIITMVLIVFVIAQIIPSTILYPMAVNFIPQAKARVSAIIQGIRLILTSIGLQVAGYCYTGSFQNIGMIMIVFIVVALITSMLVVRNREILLKSHTL